MSTEKGIVELFGKSNGNQLRHIQVCQDGQKLVATEFPVISKSLFLPVTENLLTIY